MAEAIDAELAKGFSPEDQVERLAACHRGMVAKGQQRIADTRKALKARLAGYEADMRALKADMRALKAAYDRDTVYLAELIAEAKDKAARDTEADKRIVAASKAALFALAE
ncbi:hypothetical protein [Mesorhizobium sp. B2-3-2]|uniref:hypothetical protein n=1 Tax=Mesorhizobium sp. B2-3-2 TaxID=2589961 RepID=UPI00112DF37B|nr:hypothetical protein [Mesorhizobium sp. B2-3-2]TPM37034.1 hypothetical protein FJ964_30330 [Mesorhizobium sp. B2-3-2]